MLQLEFSSPRAGEVPPKAAEPDGLTLELGAAWDERHDRLGVQPRVWTIPG